VVGDAQRAADDGTEEGVAVVLDDEQRGGRRVVGRGGECLGDAVVEGAQAKAVRLARVDQRPGAHLGARRQHARHAPRRLLAEQRRRRPACKAKCECARLSRQNNTKRGLGHLRAMARNTTLSGRRCRSAAGARAPWSAARPAACPGQARRRPARRTQRQL